MADNNQLLNQIGNLLDTKLKTEREHNKRIIREEIAVESKRLEGKQAIAANHFDVSLNRIEDRLKDVEISNTRLEQGQAEQKTLLEAVAAGQKEIQETMATKADVLSVGVKVDKLRKRVEGIEEDTSSTRHKN